MRWTWPELRGVISEDIDFARSATPSLFHFNAIFRLPKKPAYAAMRFGQALKTKLFEH